MEKSTRTLDALIIWTDTTIAISKNRDEITGIIAYTSCKGGISEILYIFVVPGVRLKGIGKELVDYMIRNAGCSSITAETDESTANFYRCLGFRISSLGERYPGVERFICSLDIEN